MRWRIQPDPDAVVNIITGDLNQGKSEKILSIYQNLQSGDGFISRKVFDKWNFLGYEIVHLKSGQKIPLAFYFDFVPSGWDEVVQIGNFSFSGMGFAFGEKIVENAIIQKIAPIFMDEIGPLEILQDKGFHNISSKVFRDNIEFYLTIRKEMVQELLSKYDIRKYNIIEV